MPAKIRLDKLLVARGLAPSRERAQALILAGKVLVAEQKLEKPGSSVDPQAAVRLLGEDLKYVSRGGLKLELALEHWKINVRGRDCLDVGASTGGFTDIKLRQDARVRLLERTNARYLTREQVGQTVDLATFDLAFISVTLVLPAAMAAAEPREIVVLVKPQFEAGREHVSKGGIVRDPAAQQAAVQRVHRAVDGLGGKEIEVTDSPILGAEGNREFLLHAVFARQR